MFTCSPGQRCIVQWLYSLLVFAAFIAPLLTPRPVAAAPALRIVYTKPGAPDGSSGATWATARSLQSALANAAAGDEIWAAAGVYYPDEGGSMVNNSPAATFQLKNDVALYGGFAGTETMREQRASAARVTVLSGDIDNNDTNKTPTGVITDTANITGTNAFHVVTGSGTGSSAILDGFTITAGSATNDVKNLCNEDPDDCGGGIYNANGSPTLGNLILSANLAYHGGGLYNLNSSPSLNHVAFVGNQATNFGNGGGMHNDNSSPALTHVAFTRNRNATGTGGGMVNVNGSSPTLADVTFVGNLAYYGGGVSNLNSSPRLNRVTFSGNRAESSFGGGMSNFNNSNPVLINVIFSGNRASQGGGGMWNNGSSPIMTNVTFSGNQAGSDKGGGIYNFSIGSPRLQNSIMWNNIPNSIVSEGTITSTIRYSLVEGINPAGAGNLDGTLAANAPLFVRDVACGPGGCGQSEDDYGDLRLQPSSPAVDAGDNAADIDAQVATPETIANVFIDVAGRPRIAPVKILPARVDLGAHERVTNPTASPGGPYTVDEGSDLALNGAASSDDNGPVVTFAWDCTADGTTDITASIPTGSTCTYPDDGSYTLRLTVTDHVSFTGTATTTVTVANATPAYTLAANQSTFAGSAASFLLGSFSDPGVEGSWAVTVNWGDNTTPAQFTVSGTGGLLARSHTYGVQGTYNVVVSVNDGESTGTGGFQVVVNPLPPGAPAVTAPADQTADAGVAQSFALGSFADPGSNGPWQVRINWGDGSAATLFSAVSPGSLGSRPHAYAAAGAYDVVVTVSDGVLAAGAGFRIIVGSSGAGSRVYLPGVQRP